MTMRELGSDLSPDGRDTGKTIDQLMHQDVYKPSELAELFEIPLSEIEHEAHVGRLKAYIVNHHVISIKREDALAWLADRS